MALVPYNESGSCCGRQMQQQHDYCGGYHRAANSNPYQLQTLPGVEERLLQLEGDKDSLNLQVNSLRDSMLLLLLFPAFG